MPYDPFRVANVSKESIGFLLDNQSAINVKRRAYTEAKRYYKLPSRAIYRRNRRNILGKIYRYEVSF